MADEQGDWADRAVQVMAAMGRQMASLLRRLAPKPFGLISQDAGLPVFVGSHSRGGSDDHLARTRPPGAPPPITSMTLCYGVPEDPLSPYVEVFTDFTPSHSATVGLRLALGRAAGSESARLAGVPEHPGLGTHHKPPAGPLERGRLDIVVAGQPRTVRTQGYRGFHGLEFQHSGLLVQVITRRSWPDRPEFAVVTDLEPYLKAMETGDFDVIKARLRARYPNGPPRPDDS
jgi:hypothetical protein